MLNDKKTLIDRKMDSPFARMGMAWFSVWPSHLPILAPKMALKVRLGLVLCVLLASAYWLAPRLSCALETQCKVANIDVFHSRQNIDQSRVAQVLVLPAWLGNQPIEWRLYQNAGIYSNNIFVRVDAVGQPQQMLQSAELLNHLPFEFDFATLRRNWDGGWLVSLKNTQGELLLSPLGTPRLIRYRAAASDGR
ncbi:hypothetical protein HQ393_08475 [Chitinibacter bivalviorum]|uniref:Uncharacterized protein n=1 Tax=Chitinibacter bivalviorum TaxID=2739434 RepID=A0A7H9BIJ2_9NEIS|nr:hypothetical protein [Chitinibacter bivalviorum]QLG88279.1 hypothetical protein HQ393_08475 [Chitinibacter bivalviorum]